MEGPGIPEGSSPNKFIGLEDIMPTVLSAAGIKAPESLDGKNLFDLLNGRAANWRDSYYVQTEKRGARTLQRCIRTKKQKLILSWDEEHEFYDLQIDPEEELNIFDAPKRDKQNQYRHYSI